MKESIRSFPVPAPTPGITIDFSPHGEAFSYNVGEVTYSPANTYLAYTKEEITFTATIVFASDKQWAVGYEWDFGHGFLSHTNPATYEYLLPLYAQVNFAMTDNFGSIWYARKGMYLIEEP